MSKEELLFSIGTIETEKLLIRKITAADEEDLSELRTDESTNEYLGGIKSREGTIKFINMELENYANNKIRDYAVELKEVKKVIGLVGLKINEKDNKGTISYVFNSQYWHKGYCTEVIKTLIKLGFEKLNLNRIEADSVKENVASIKVLENNGMTYEGTRREAGYDISKDVYYDFNDYSILKREYFKNKKI